MTPEEIAAGLSEAQRAAILDAEDRLSNHGGYPFFTVRLTHDPWPQGIAQFLTLKTDRLTPLGLEVRAALTGRQG
jgi:hypothetical protein